MLFFIEFEPTELGLMEFEFIVLEPIALWLMEALLMLPGGIELVVVEAVAGAGLATVALLIVLLDIGMFPIALFAIEPDVCAMAAAEPARPKPKATAKRSRDMGGNSV